MNLTEAFLEVSLRSQTNDTLLILLTDTRVYDLKGMRDPTTTRYAIYDFGHSLMYPYETVLEDVTETRFMNFVIRGLPAPPGPYNPFQADVAFLGKILQRYVRISTINHDGKLINLIFKIQPIADIGPDIGPLFDSMTDNDAKKCLTARQALETFRKIHSTLSPLQLSCN
jgi:hypothetical protein